MLGTLCNFESEFLGPNTFISIIKNKKITNFPLRGQIGGLHFGYILILANFPYSPMKAYTQNVTPQFDPLEENWLFFYYLL